MAHDPRRRRLLGMLAGLPVLGPLSGLALGADPECAATRRDLSMAEGLRYVYLGNVAGHPGNNTYCPACGKVVIHRIGMAMMENRLDSGRCPDCRHEIPGVWS